MKILVINSGSSSLKYQLIEMPDQRVLCSGLVDRIAQSESVILHKVFIQGLPLELAKKEQIKNHQDALMRVTELLSESDNAVIDHPDEIDVIGHRVVHGGERFAKTSLITDQVKQSIKALFDLAPLHNPNNYLGIETAERIFPHAKQVAVFDTAFHQSMPDYAYRYAIPEFLYSQNRIRAYGFHGTSHKYVSEKASEYLRKENLKIISIHLGNGCSMAAINSGVCLDTSMGFGPMSGLIMGTRCGDIDGSVIFHLIDNLNYTPAQAQSLLNNESGMRGLAGHSDLRQVRAKFDAGDSDAMLAYQAYTYRIKKYIGSYAAVLNGLDALIFTGGVGENDAMVRALSLSNLEFLGVEIDPDLNLNLRGEIREIQSAASRVRILVVATNEELEIAKQCYEMI